MRREAAILVDDSLIGILAAKNAGMDSVLIGNSDEQRVEKYEGEPTFSVKNIAELRRVL
jgi:beta-phosphoglucomutase-like phosphatase (HAD superfamily)